MILIGRGLDQKKNWKEFIEKIAWIELEMYRI